MWIVKLALRRPYTFVVMALLILFLGVSAIKKTPTDIFPEIDIPVVTVLWQYAGLSPDQMAKQITTFSEYTISSAVDNVKNIESQTLAGVSVIRIFFQPNVRIDSAIAQVTAVSQTILRRMPPGAQPPTIIRYNASSVPILQLALGSRTLTKAQLYDYGIYRVRQAIMPTTTSPLTPATHGLRVAALEMIRQPGFFAAFDVTMFPILNPDGLAGGVRTNRDGIDLNRDYRNSRSLEIKGHIETLLTLDRFDASMMLHEDYEGIGAYLYELNDTLDPGLGAKIIAAMGLHVPIDLRPEIEEWAARGGVISGRDFIAKLGPLEDLPEWAEAIYLSVHHTDAVYTIETPKPFPIKALIAAVETLMNALKG